VDREPPVQRPRNAFDLGEMLLDNRWMAVFKVAVECYAVGEDNVRLLMHIAHALRML
jgi:hypothetical protein